MALMANLQRDPKKRAKPFTLEEFRLRWTRPEPQSAADMKAIAKALTAQYGRTPKQRVGGG